MVQWLGELFFTGCHSYDDQCNSVAIDEGKTLAVRRPARNARYRGS